MKITNRLTTNIPTEEGIEQYMVEIDRPDMDEDIFYIRIYHRGREYSRFMINQYYGILNGYELNYRECLILKFISNRLELDL